QDLGARAEGAGRWQAIEAMALPSRSRRNPGKTALRERQVVSTRVGFAGLGTMGAPMALNALKAGFSLTVFDPREEAMRGLVAEGAVAVQSARELGEKSEVVQLAVP